MNNVCPCCGAAVSDMDLLLDKASGTVTHQGTSVRFTPSQFRLLSALIDSYPRVLSKDQCLDAIVGDRFGDGPEVKIVDVQVCKMRPMADMVGLAITTVWGTGYRLELAEEIKSEILRKKRFDESRFTKSSVDSGDIAAVKMLKKRGYPLTEIARRLKLTFKAVATAIDAIDAEGLTA